MILLGSNRWKEALYGELISADDPYAVRSSRDIDTVVDLGANCGLFTLLARCLHPKARVIALEPDPHAFGALSTNSQYLHVETFHAAVGGKDRWASPDWNPKAGCGGRQYRSRWKVNPDGVGCPRVAACVPSFTLDELWTEWRPEGRVLLKFDIEGAEHNWVGDAAAERRLESCAVVAGEVHAGRCVESDLTEEHYREWLTRRFSATHEISASTRAKRPRATFLDVVLRRKEP